MRTRLYVGMFPNQDGRAAREVFRSASEPTRETHGTRYAACIGPFRTRAAAVLCANGLRCNGVSEYERVARTLAIQHKACERESQRLAAIIAAHR